jgi:ribosome-binding protein aMBF1 (putative translation factor)
MPYYGPKELSKEIARLQALQEELAERIELAKQGHQVRVQLLAHCKKEGLSRSDVGWVYAQMPATRITKVSRLKRAAAAKAKRNVGKNIPKPELVPMGSRIEAGRHAMELSLKQAGAKLDLHPSVLSGYEKGKWRAGPEAAAKIEKLYGITIKYPNSNGSK